MTAISHAFSRYFPRTSSSLGEELNKITENSQKKKEIERQKSKENQEAEWTQCFGALPADSKEAVVAKKVLQHNSDFFKKLPDNCRTIARMGYLSGTVGIIPKVYRSSQECDILDSELNLLSQHELFQRKFKGIYLSAVSSTPPEGYSFNQCAIKATWKKG